MWRGKGAGGEAGDSEPGPSVEGQVKSPSCRLDSMGSRIHWLVLSAIIKFALERDHHWNIDDGLEAGIPVMRVLE